MKKLLIGLMVFGLCSSHIHAMQMGNAKKQSPKSSSTTCGNAVKACCYLTAMGGLMTSAQPVNGNAGNLAAGYTAGEGAGREGLMAGCYSIGTHVMVYGFSEPEFGMHVSAETNPQFLARCYAEVIRQQHFSFSTCGAGNAANCHSQYEERYEEERKERKRLEEALKRLECARLLKQEEADHKEWAEINAMQWAMFKTSNERREMRKKIEKRDAQREQCRDQRDQDKKKQQ